MYFSHLDIENATAPAEIVSFLKANDLDFDVQIEKFVVGYNDQDEIIACGGLAGKIIKCVAISESCRGEGVALKLATELVNIAYELGRTQLFIYTKPEYARLFRDCGFYTLVAAQPDVVLLENSATRLKRYTQQLASQRVEGEKIGAIVMNANPFTLGHRYLITQALEQCDHLHLFVVGENASEFTYQERFELVQQGIADLPRVTLHAGTDYIISRATFPTYFLKDKGLTEHLYLELDLRLFRQFIAPALNITHRFVGTEPICAVTNEYNRQMHFWLEKAELHTKPIQVVEIERKTEFSQPISASNVRALFAENDWKALSKLVPPSTFDFLQLKRYGKVHSLCLWWKYNVNRINKLEGKSR